MRIRRIEAHEGARLRDVRLRALVCFDAPDAFGTTLAEASARDDASWSESAAAGASGGERATFFAEEDGQLVGLAGGGRVPEEPDSIFVYSMWADPSIRGRGAGRALLDAVLAWAAEQGARRVALDVTEGNEPARRLYERAGFVATGKTEPLRPGSALRIEEMERLLSIAATYS